MPRPSLFILERSTRWPPLDGVLRRLPPLRGEPVRIFPAKGLRDRHGEVHAGTFLRERRIGLNCTLAEFPRIFVHELFHFVWLKAGNPIRLSYEGVLLREAGKGELGWSAEWRKEMLTAADIEARSRRWRDYCCESFCDTAAWIYSGTPQHPEFTLPRHFRQSRRIWFRKTIEPGGLSI